MEPNVEHDLCVTWRRPDCLIVPVGKLTQRRDGDDVSYEFVYLKMAETFEGFSPLAGLADLHRRYRSDQLFPVFANRQMPRSRPDYGDFLRQLDLTSETDPFEVMARSEGIRATDRIEVFSGPTLTETGDLTSLFFARGVRYIDGASAAVDDVQEGDELVLTDAPENEVNPRAILLNTHTNAQVGYVPDYLLSMIHELREIGSGEIRVVAEHVNPPSTVPHMRLLCRLTTAWPDGYVPFSEPEMAPIVAGGFS